MPYPPIHLGVRVASPFCSEFPDGPLGAVLGVEPFDEVFERCAVGDLRVCCAWARGGDYVVGYVAEVYSCFGVLGARTCDDLAEE